MDGRRVGDDTERVVLALHKPVGLHHRRAAIPAAGPPSTTCSASVGAWVFPVGRLDRDTSGLLVLTNDHRLGQRLTDPRRHVPKTYHVRVRGVPGRGGAARRCARASPSATARAHAPGRVRALGTPRGGGAWLEIVLTEGRNRQVRRMCAAVGHDVQELVRVRIGGLALGDLAPGAWRRLDARTRSALEQRGSSLRAAATALGWRGAGRRATLLVLVLELVERQ